MNGYHIHILLEYLKSPNTRLKLLKKLYLVLLKFVLKLLQNLILFPINIHISKTKLLNNLYYLSYPFLCNGLKPEFIYLNVLNNLNYFINPYFKAFVQ